MKILRIIILYLFSLACIGFFIYLNNSQDLANWLTEVNSNNTGAGLRLYIFVGLVKLVSILLGVTLFAMLTIRIIKGNGT